MSLSGRPTVLEKAQSMRRLVRNPIAIAIAFGFSLLAATATASAGVLPPTQ
jgi:hypothetical protein